MSTTPAGPPHYWYCDVCDMEITDPERGLMLSRQRRNDKQRWEEYDFILVHKSGVGGPNCDPEGPYALNLEIADVVGVDGLTRLLAFLNPGPLIDRDGSIESSVGDLRTFVDVIRRLHTPLYEEARRHFMERRLRQELSDANEVFPYRQAILGRIVAGEFDDEDD